MSLRARFIAWLLRDPQARAEARALLFPPPTQASASAALQSALSQMQEARKSSTKALI